MTKFFVLLVMSTLFFSACSSKTPEINVDTKTQQNNAKEALKDL
jgi:PBP1b-binding outer membrane lipoprotein LpoB